MDRVLHSLASVVAEDGGLDTLVEGLLELL